MKKRDDRLYEDEDYINSEKYEHSLSKALLVRPEGLSNSAISKVLCISAKELKKELTRILNKIRQILNE